MRYNSRWFLSKWTALLVLSVLIGCREPKPKYDGIENVTVAREDQIDICTYRYAIDFNDDHKTRGAAWYWVGLRRVNLNLGSEILARSAPIWLEPPFYTELTIEVVRGDLGETREEVTPAAYRTKFTDDVYDLSHVEDSDDGTSFNLPWMPENCCDLTISVTSGVSYVNPGTEIYIDANPTMPSIQVTAISPVSPDTIDYELVISYTRSGRSDWDTLRYSGLAGIPWNASNQLLGRIGGGQIRTKCRSHRNNCSQLFDFCIRGYNPDQWNVENTIASYNDDEWHWRYIAMQESDSAHQGRYYAQFNTYYNDFYISCDPNDAYGIEGTPNASGDGGFGIFQLTGIGWDEHRPAAQTLWSWKANIDTARWWLNLIEGEAVGWMNDQRGQCVADHEYDPGWYWSVPDHSVGNVVFSDNDNGGYPESSNNIVNACGMKRYNGTTGGWYCYYWNSEHRWDWNELNTENPPRNYVSEVCARVPEARATTRQSSVQTSRLR
jgi:hypothetical protein